MGGTVAFPSVFDLQKMVDELMPVYQPLTERKSIRMLVESEKNLLVYADENQVQLIMRNLIDNAIKFTPLEQSIRIRLKREDKSISICISNPYSDLLNKDFLQADQIQSPAYGTANEKGVGLGLHLCRAYIAQNGGALLIGFDDNQVTFCFKLPGADDIELPNTH